MFCSRRRLCVGAASTSTTQPRLPQGRPIGRAKGATAPGPKRGGAQLKLTPVRFLVSTKLQREEWLEGRSGSSAGQEEGKAWSALWNIPILSKIKLFIWRLARHSLHTTDVLHHRNMATQGTCPLCGCQDSWRHTLISCTMSRCVWALSDADVLLAMAELEEPSAKRWLFELCSRMDHSKFTTMVVTL